MNYLIHVANVLYLVSYLVRDILWLRVLTIVAATTLLPYFYANGLYPPIAWNALFLAINIYQVYRLLLERRPVQLDENDERLYHLAFRALKPREFVKLLAAGERRTADAGSELVAQGSKLDNLLVVESGNAEVRVDGRAVAELGPGHFVGEMSYLTGDETSAAVRAGEELRYVCWPREQLDRVLTDSPDIRGALQTLIGTDLVRKLRAT